ncbi:MAG: M48 family metallopeptidase [Patescibacteria group bacterium]
MYKITYRSSFKARNISIKISESDGVVVSFPPFIPRMVVDHFVKSKNTWIEQKLLSFAKNKKNRNILTIFGRDFQLLRLSDQSRVPKVTINKDKVYVNSWKTGKHSQILESFLKNKATLYITKRTQQLAQHMGITYKQITLRQQKTRWGSCSNQGNLNFNWRLIHHPNNVIDYVIIHELSHRKFMDHSKGFWKLVEKFDPEYRIHRGWLKRNGQLWSE